MTEQSRRLKVGLVSPYPWASQWGINRHIAGLASELAQDGHAISIIAPAEEKDGQRAARRRAKATRRGKSWETASAPASTEPEDARADFSSSRSTEGGVHILKISGTFHFPYSEHLANLALPMDVTERLNALLGQESFDVLHVHEPYPPSLSFTALRLSHCPVVATFHTGGERFLSFQLMRPVVERFFGRLDGRICTSQNTRRIVSSYFPGNYDVISSGVDTRAFHADPVTPDDAGPLVVFAAWSDPRKGMALLTRTLRLLPDDIPRFRLAVVGGEKLAWRPSLIVPRRLRQRVVFQGSARSKDELLNIYQGAEALLAPYATSAQTTAVLEAMACGCATIVPGEGGLKELVSEGSSGYLLDHPYSYNLAADIVDLLVNERVRRNLGAAAARRATRDAWEKTTPRVTKVYAGAYRRRQGKAPSHSAIEPVEEGETILADLHMHTSYSSDCQTTPAELLAACQDSGIEAIAVTDHNCIDGALEVSRLAPPDMHVIVGEEVKTTGGEIIGLYINEEIPKGLSLEETIARIKAQGGLVYVPHPFDPLHKTPSYEVLARNAADIDIIEVYNPRITFTSFNDRARRLARKYDIPGAAGSDCHVPEGVGTAMISLQRFTGPRELLLSLRQADVIRSKVSPIYLHSLKLLKNSRSSRGDRVQ